MKKRNRLQALGWLAAIAVCFAMSAKAQTPQNIEAFATVSADAAEIRWQPDREYSRLVLTVSMPNGKVIRKEFDTNAAASLKLTDETGNMLADGEYKYELRLVPNFSRETKRTLAKARDKGDIEKVIDELQRNGKLPTKAFVQSGAFLIQAGQVHTGGEEEPGNSKGKKVSTSSSGKKGGGEFTIMDQVIPDDLIVQASLCVGFDCVNNESFGTDTIKLKENNLRIKFEDTSTGAFPSNDWQLTANDSTSGGANKFSIEDITGARVPFTITAGAATNSIFVDSIGRVGFRTSTPVLELHTNDSDTPGIRLEQNSSGGFTAQTWDIAGNEANFFVRDVTGGSLLPFRIRPGAPTSSLDIAASGKVGISIGSPEGALHIANNGDQWSSFNNGSNLIIKEETGATARNPAIGIFDSANANPWAIVNNGGGLRFSQMPALGNTATAPTERVIFDASGNVGIGTLTPGGKLDVNGSIFQRGGVLHADYVFEPTYMLESIEDHANFMWSYKHLPAIGARQVDEQGREVLEIGTRMRGMLEEIEKAHIYISELNEKIKNKEDQLTKLQRQNAELSERLARIEALLGGAKTNQK